MPPIPLRAEAVFFIFYFIIPGNKSGDFTCIRQEKFDIIKKGDRLLFENFTDFLQFFYTSVILMGYNIFKY